MLKPIPLPDHRSIEMSAVRHLPCKAGTVSAAVGALCAFFEPQRQPSAQIVVYIVPLAHCVFGWRGKTERRAMLSKAFPRMYTENEANARLQPWLPKGTPKL